ncbi:hypothetical protein ACQUSR_23110 [Streptomyces sp. P1-3]|uniref:hypothetical protein n=1 Tax=Streptomyces sp. P1-3 TaxID=3421658 RepID=UPI003D35FE18
MSIPGDQPNPYAQQPYGPPQPQHGQPNPYASQVPPQQPVAKPGAPGPYAQPTLPGTPLPAPGGFGSATPPPAAPPTGAGRSKGWLWGLGGAVVASAVWAGVLFATGAFDGEEKADLAGYRYTDDLCAATELKPFKDRGFEVEEPEEDEENPESSGGERPALASMQCSVNLKSQSSSDSDYSNVWTSSSARLHKKTDPAPEFEASYREYADQGTSKTSYAVKAVTGIGDEAYLVTQSEKGEDGENRNDGEYLILGVRDGWMTYSITWSQYVGTSSTETPVSVEDAEKMITESARGTLAKLRSGESADG